MNENKVLVVDDEDSVRALLSLVLTKAGYEVLEAANGLEAVECAKKEAPAVIIMDIRMPKMDGMTAFRTFRQLHLDAAVILMTAFAEVNAAVEAMKTGAFDYVIKPFNIEEIKLLIARAVESRRLAAEVNLLRQELSSVYRLNNTLTNSPAMKQIYNTAARVAATSATVLITGESGTGKELMVNMIHYNSPRAKGPLIKVNCSALPETLLESELFGHEKGAFTNAVNRRVGRFEQANKGTIFLDEIGEMPLSVQVKLLRVLQEHEFERIGGNQTIKTDIRIVAATNRSLPEMVANGTFREDLYYRLAVVNIHMPPLRERPEDIMLLARLFLQKYAQEMCREVDDFDAEAAALMCAYRWPGNVRELSNIVERAVVMGNGRLIFPEDLPSHLQADALEEAMEASPSLCWQGRKLRDILKETEKTAIANVLRCNEGNRMKTARDLEMSRRALQYKIEEYGLDKEKME